MKRWIPALAALALIAVVLTGCPPKQPPTSETAASCVPYDVQADANDGLIVVSFRSDCKALITGYNIYLSREPLAAKYPGPELPATIKPYNQPVFPGDTDPSDHVEHYEAEGVENGVKYYISVRTVFADRSLSKPSEEIMAVAGPRGQMELAPRYKSDQDGWSFANNDYVRADAIDNDMYFYVKDNQYFLASPDRLGFLRKTLFRVLPYKGGIDEVGAKMTAKDPLPSEDRVAVKKDDWIEVMTADKTFALVKVLGISGKGDDSRLQLFYVWTPAEGAPAF